MQKKPSKRRRYAAPKTTIRWSYTKKRWQSRNGFERVIPCMTCGKEELMCAGRLECWDCKAIRKAKVEKIRAPAMRAVHKAVMDGRLTNLKTTYVLCSDCELHQAKVYDHREYAKPLQVEPVCCGCNSRRGPARDIAHLLVRNRLTVVASRS